MSIVCATNFSKSSAGAAVAAAALAHKRGVPLWLVHVLPADLARAGGEPMRALVQRTLQDDADRLSAAGATVYPQLVEGKIAEGVVRFAEERKASLVVAGTHRRETPFAGMGGKLDRLALEATLPLLVVKDPEPFLAWTRGARPLRVLLGVGDTATFEPARRWISELKRYGPIELVAGHVYYVFEACERLGLPVRTTFDELPATLGEALRREVLELVGPQPPTPDVSVRLQPGVGRQADHLIELARSEAADLIVVGTHHRRGVSKLWSVSHHTLRLAPVSVAVVPTRVDEVEVAMPRLRRVMVTTDFSDAANRAVPYAFSIVGPGGEVHLVHVAQPGLMPQQRAELAARLLRLVPQQARAQGKRAVPEIVESLDVDEGIAHAAERLDADALCIGSHGRSGVARAVLGSVTEEVMKQCRRPVLVVRPDER